MNSMLGEALDASGQTSDATRYYQKALTIAKSMQRNSRLQCCGFGKAAGDPESRGIEL